MMTHEFSMREFLRQIMEENNFQDLDEPELITLNRSSSSSSSSSTSSSNISSDSTIINQIFTPPSLVQSNLSTTTTTTKSSPSMPTVFSFSPSLRWLLPPQYDPLTVVWSTNNNNNNNNNSINTSQSMDLSPIKETQTEIQSIANTLFRHIDKDMYNDTEFHEFLQEWYKDNEENCMKSSKTNLDTSRKRKHE